MSNTPKITDRQLALLCDLLALEEAGLILQRGVIIVTPGYDEGSLVGEVGGVLTHEGVYMVREFKRSGRTITL